MYDSIIDVLAPPLPPSHLHLHEALKKEATNHGLLYERKLINLSSLSFSSDTRKFHGAHWISHGSPDWGKVIYWISVPLQIHFLGWEYGEVKSVRTRVMTLQWHNS